MRPIWPAAGVMFAAVALGAFGAHGLKSILEETDHQGTWATAVLYQAIHGLALLAISIWRATDARAGAAPLLGVAGWLWIAGVVAFSGSLYFLSLGGPKWLGPVTPLGGICFLAGWVVLAIGAAKLGPHTSRPA